ncbi:uncharacterized protein LOC110344895 isoform X2 [Heterocephalus glaber]|uniref:Uncharacterized protein LOC110344895 isoform X2 n=1 Tax=Heterocephalus glaber TaxID=10181 RepID=A0AAX6REI7_HETGA|nr:uncharacterized protein LOC110344895 isoform X2 [Heterocephalus glaber]
MLGRVGPGLGAMPRFPSAATAPQPRRRLRGLARLAVAMATSACRAFSRCDQARNRLEPAVLTVSCRKETLLAVGSGFPATLLTPSASGAVGLQALSRPGPRPASCVLASRSLQT